MPLTMRPIPHALNLGAPEIYGQGPSGQGAQGTQVLEDVNMASMVGTLAQLGALATYAQDMFDGLFQTADTLANQVSAASGRCSRLLQALPGAEERTAEAIGSGTGIDDNAAIEAIKAERHHANQAESESAAKVFLPEAMPRWLVERYHSPEVTRVPDLHLIDAVISPEEKQLLRKDGLDSCALRYSNPQFFYQEWYRLELERQEKSVLEKRQKKEERKRRKAAAKAAAGARAGGQQDEESSRVQRPARKSISDWRGKFAMGAAGLGIGSAGGGGGGVSRGASSRSSPGDVSSLVSNEKVVVQKREAYGDKFYRQEEDFADTGYQVNSSDPGAGAANTPNASAVEQLGALTAADFDRKPGAINDDTRRLFKPPSARAIPSSTQQQQQQQPPAPLPPRPQQRPPPPQAPAARPGASTSPPPPPPPPTSARPPALPQPPPAAAMLAGYSSPPDIPAERPSPGPSTYGAPHSVPPPPPTSRPLPPQAPPPPPPPPPPRVLHVRRPSFQEPIVPPPPTLGGPEVEEAPSRPSYEVWGVDQQPQPPQPPQNFGYGAPSVAPPVPFDQSNPAEVSEPSEWSPQPPAPPPAPPSRLPMPPPLPPVAEASPSGQPPLPPPLRPPAPMGGVPPAPPPLPPAIGGGAGGPGEPGGAGGPGGASASARGSLLASITDGKKLKKMERPPPAPGGGGGGGGNDLLSAIRSGAQLKKVEPREAAPPVETNNPPLGVNPGINEILARRKYLEAESEDSDSDDDSDWDED